MKRASHHDSAIADPALQNAIEEASAKLDFKTHRLPSGAGHDAVAFDGFTDIGMLFVRCGNGGISHHPDEALDAADARLAANVFRDFLLHYKAS